MAGAGVELLMIAFRKFFLWILTLGMTGCGIDHMDYFKPTGPGNYSKGPCGGPDQNLFIHLAKGLAIEVSTLGMREETGRTISVSIRLGDGHSLKLESPVVVVIGKDGRRIEREIESFSYFESDRSTIPHGSIMHSFPATSVLRGAAVDKGEHSILRSDDENNRRYISLFDASGIEEKEFHLQLPRLLLDGEVVQPPDIKIEFVTETVIAHIC